MSILLKLIGCGSVLEMNVKMKEDKFGLKEIESVFEELGFDSEEIRTIKIIVNAKDLRNEEMKDFICDEPDTNVFIFSNSPELKQKLIKVFDKNSINKEINIVEEEKNPVLDDKVIETMNKKIVELFKKDNFKILINIWMKEPEMFKEFFRYINNGNIVNIDIPDEAKDKMFNKEIEILKELGINKSDDEICKILRLYNGHLNFALRDLLTKD